MNALDKNGVAIKEGMAVKFSGYRWVVKSISLRTVRKGQADERDVVSVHIQHTAVEGERTYNRWPEDDEIQMMEVIPAVSAPPPPAPPPT